jgi:hypothetical protein
MTTAYLLPCYLIPWTELYCRSHYLCVINKEAGGKARV